MGENSPAFKDSPKQPTLNIASETVDFPPNEESNSILLFNHLPLNNNDFLSEKKDRDFTGIIKLFAPYTLSLEIVKDTKVNISKSSNGEVTQLMNQVVLEGEKFEFDFESTINFEFWSAEHLHMKLNEIPMDNFLSDGNFAIRGSYEAEKSQLYLGFYRH